MKSQFVDRLISILAGLAVTGGLAWGLYLQGRVDNVVAKAAVHDTALEADKIRFEYISKSLERIEEKLEHKEKK